MADLENVVVEEQPETPVEPSENKPSKGKKFAAGLKEWCRKKVVSLKRNPQRIAQVWQVIVTFVWLITLFTYSSAIYDMNVEWTGLVVFVNTLFSILVIVLFLNSFPKRKKPNIVMLVLLFVFLAVIIGCDVLYYVLCTNHIDAGNVNAAFLQSHPKVEKSLSFSIMFIVFEAIAAILVATLPLYTRLLRKINTRKDFEENKLSEEIDTSAEV